MCVCGGGGGGGGGALRCKCWVQLCLRLIAGCPERARVLHFVLRRRLQGIAIGTLTVGDAGGWA